MQKHKYRVFLHLQHLKSARLLKDYSDLMVMNLKLSDQKQLVLRLKGRIVVVFSCEFRLKYHSKFNQINYSLITRIYKLNLKKSPKGYFLLDLEFSTLKKCYFTLKVTLLANLLASSESFWIDVSAPAAVTFNLEDAIPAFSKIVLTLFALAFDNFSL